MRCLIPLILSLLIFSTDAVSQQDKPDPLPPDATSEERIAKLEERMDYLEGIMNTNASVTLVLREGLLALSDSHETKVKELYEYIDKRDKALTHTFLQRDSINVEFRRQISALLLSIAGE